MCTINPQCYFCNLGGVCSHYRGSWNGASLEPYLAFWCSWRQVVGQDLWATGEKSLDFKPNIVQVRLRWYSGVWTAAPGVTDFQAEGNVLVKEWPYTKWPDETCQQTITGLCIGRRGSARWCPAGCTAVCRTSASMQCCRGAECSCALNLIT